MNHHTCYHERESASVRIMDRMMDALVICGFLYVAFLFGWAFHAVNYQ